MLYQGSKTAVHSARAEHNYYRVPLFIIVLVRKSFAMQTRSARNGLNNVTLS